VAAVAELGTLGGTPRNTMRRFLPTKFQLRERILSGLAVALAGIAFYFVFTAAPRRAPGMWVESLFLGTMLFVAIGGRDRAFFTALYCALLSGALATLASIISVYRMPWRPDFASWPSELAALMFGLFLLLFSVAIPVAFAWSVTRFIQFLERQFYR